ncbi:cysteine desulfurase/selenocysteine lyase [Sphingobium xenophagum]|uniref:Cysteine desulfurase/selenocysteine lyase n=1 Tax=Sphingobium xenophagum TaxID=121428 RepID=A0A401J206_SPHXE|nr:cysteine desulfurase/selenocysteine lyase [Sphingobium xenophagum]
MFGGTSGGPESFFSVRPEPVEGLLFPSEEGQGFDTLSPNGF